MDGSSNTPPADQSAVATATGAAPAASVENQVPAADPDAPACEVGAAAGAGGEEVESDEEGVTERHTVDGNLFRALTAVGFSENAVKKSIACGCVDEQTCTQWLQMHLDFPELNEPLEPHIRVRVRERRALTAEEREAKVAELKAKIGENRARERAEMSGKERQAELSRMQLGRDMLKAKEERDKRTRDAAYQERMREKSEAQAAKAKIELQLAVDRYRRQGLGDEEARARAAEDLERRRQQLAAERQAALAKMEAARAEEKSREEDAASRPWDLGRLVDRTILGDEGKAGGGAAGASSGGLTVDFDREVALPPPTEAGFTTLLARARDALAERHGADGAAAAKAQLLATLSTLRRIIGNIAERPMEASIRTVKTTSATFVGKVAAVPMACAVLRLAGFVEAEDALSFSLPFLVIRRVQAAMAAINGFEAATVAA